MLGPGVSTMPSATSAKAIQLAKCGICDLALWGGDL